MITFQLKKLKKYIKMNLHLKKLIETLIIWNRLVEGCIIIPTVANCIKKGMV